MFIALIVLIVLIVLSAIALAVSYNRLITHRLQCRNSFANIETELRRRYDLISNLVESVRGYAAHEREVFDEVTRARAAAVGTAGASPATRAAVEGPLVQGLGRLLAVAENYPELKANQNFLALQAELSNTENRIQATWATYNGNVRDYNRRVQSFPSNALARTFGFHEEEFFEIPAAERPVLTEAPRVGFGTQGEETGGSAGTASGDGRQNHLGYHLPG